VIRIIVVDDQRLVRRCLRARLDAVEDFAVVAEAESGEQARELARAQDFDVILMDLNMPGIGGLEATRRLLVAKPDARIIGLSMYVEGPYPAKFMEIGGAGYLSKNTDATEVITAIRRVHGGDYYISDDVAQRIAASELLPAHTASGMNDLTRREIQVLHHLSEGSDVDEIAARLSLSPKTIGYHRRRLLQKFGVHNDVQLSLAARNCGLTDVGALIADEAE
jgi:two-component system invasion response regulator UvrY